MQGRREMLKSGGAQAQHLWDLKRGKVPDRFWHFLPTKQGTRAPLASPVLPD